MSDDKKPRHTSRTPRRDRPRRLPGDPTPAQLVERMIRVDHAGEFGAVRIYKGQLAVLGGSGAGDTIEEMAAAERRHLETFERLIVERRARPTVLSPLWHVAGYALGAATAMLGEKAAMACTVAVEEVIDEHYQRQREALEALGTQEADLRDTIEAFRRDEVEHRDTALAEGAAEAPAYALLSGAIKAGSRAAIWLSTRV